MANEAVEQEALEQIMSDASAEPMKLSYGLLRSITNNFSNEIGRGGFGVVYKGFLQNGDVAVKKLLNLHTLSEKQFMDEITCLKKAKNKNIVRFLGYCSETQGELFQIDGVNVMADAQQKFLCFENVPNGNIKNYLQQEKSDGDDWPLRYKMIRGLCQGLYYLHGEHINHLDLKPENVMLDANMEPKITDFGLSRCLDQDQSKIVTQNICGTLRYIAPETIDNNELSLKSDIYALGIIIIELLTGIDKISLHNWDESLDDLDCPRVRSCTEIARACTDRNKHNRPTIVEVVSDLDKLESMIPQSSTNQVASSMFYWTELMDVHPLQMSFPFVPNQEMHCHLELTNKTNGAAVVAIIPDYPERFHWGAVDFSKYQYMPTSCTTAVTLYRKAIDALPVYMDIFNIQILEGMDEFEFCEKLSTLSVLAAARHIGCTVHMGELRASVVSEEDHQGLVVDTTCWEEEEFTFESIDVHPTEPWVLIGLCRKQKAQLDLSSGETIVYIWNWKTNEKLGEYMSDGYRHSAKFIGKKLWVVMGSSDGSILVHKCPTMHQLKQFKAHRGVVTLLAVHPTRPFLLSSDANSHLKLWDWNLNWCCIGIFEVNATQMMFNPKNANTFTSVDLNGEIVMWRIGQSDPIANITSDKLSSYLGPCRLFSYTSGRNIITSNADRSVVNIVDPLKKECLHIFRTTEDITYFTCHPTRPICITVSLDGFIHVWDCITYRLKKTYVTPRKDPLYIGFTGSRRLVIGNKVGITVMDADLE